MALKSKPGIRSLEISNNKLIDKRSPNNRIQNRPENGGWLLVILNSRCRFQAADAGRYLRHEVAFLYVITGSYKSGNHPVCPRRYPRMACVLRAV